MTFKKSLKNKLSKFYSILGQTNIVVANKNYFQEYKPIEIANDVLQYTIVRGVLEKIIRYRVDEKQVSMLLNEIKWWDKDLEWIKNNFKIMHDMS